MIWRSKRKLKIEEQESSLEDARQEITECRILIDTLQRTIDNLKEKKDKAYEERNRLVALLAVIYPSVRTKTSIEGWSDDWHSCVYIQLPFGQVSWHYHDSQSHLFSEIPEGEVEWDGHTTEEKYQKIEQFVAAQASIRRGIEQSKNNEVTYLESFRRYLDDDDAG